MHIHNIRQERNTNGRVITAVGRKEQALRYTNTIVDADKSRTEQQQILQRRNNRFSLSPGELPGYTGWARPEQTLAGYFDITSLSHPPLHKGLHETALTPKFHSIVKSGDKFSLLLTCNHNRTDVDTELEPPYECPPNGGSLFYVRAYGPAVITGLVTDYQNASYAVEMQFIDPGEYTLEIVVTFSVPLAFDEFPLNQETIDMDEEEIIEPGYEGYMASGFPLTLRVDPAQEPTSLLTEGTQRQWCSLSQLTETSPQSALYKGHWQVIDNVARSFHNPLTPDGTMVSLDGYRMGLNSVGVRMRYEYEDCELIHIREIMGGFSGGMDKCFQEWLGFNLRLRNVGDNSTNMSSNRTIAGQNSMANGAEKVEPLRQDDRFEGIHVIFIGDSVMKLVMGFFSKLVRDSFSVKVSFLETNGGLHLTMSNITSTLEDVRQTEKGANVKRVILFNSGLHDIDILCCSKRRGTRVKAKIASKGKSCSDEYREAMMQFVQVLNEYPAELKVFRSTTAGWQKYGNYGFSWRANDMQPMSRSPHLAHHFNTIAFDVIQNLGSNILIVDGYWLTLPRPDHTQTSFKNNVGKHLVHPGFEVLSVFARRWFMMILHGLCGKSFRSCMICIGGSNEEL